MNLRNRLPFYISLIQQGLEWFGYPLICTKAKAKPLKNYKVYGNTEQGGIPESYTRLEYIESDGNPYIVTDFFFDDVATDVLTCDFMRTTTGAGSLLYGFRDAYKVNGYGFQFNDQGRTYRQYGDSDTGLGSAALKNLNTKYTVQQTGYIYTIDGSTYTGTATTAPIQNYPLTVFATRNADQETTVITPMRLYNLNVVNASGKMILNLVPVRRKDGALGIYDTIKGGFYMNTGAGNFVAGPEIGATPIQPLMIESVGDKTVNLFDKATITKGKYISQAGAVTANASFCYGDYISVVPNTDYIISGTNKGGTAYRRIHSYGADQKWIEQIKALQVQSGADYTMTFTAPEDCVYIRFSGMSSANDYEETNIVQMEEGSVVTEYEPYNMYKIPVNVAGKNMLNPNAEVYNGYIGLMNVGEAIRYGSSTASKSYKKFAYFKPGTYTYSYNGSASTGSLRFVLCDENEIVREIVSTPVVQGRNEVVVNFTKEGWGYVSALVAATDIQIEKGDTATSYEPYFNETTNIYLDEPLRKLGDYTDYIDFENQKVVRNVYCQTDIYGNPSISAERYLCNAEVEGISNIGETTIAWSNLLQNGSAYVYGEFSNIYNYIGMYRNTNNVSRIVISKILECQTVEDFQNALKDIEIYYPLRTPTEESITLPQITLPGEVTITTETTVKPSDMYGKQ